jgi:ribonuclease HI
MTTDPTCTICGREEEDGYHATMTCTKAAALRESMRKIWKLPPEEKLRNSGKEWTLNILNASSPDMRGKLMLVWWRAWHLRNNCIFGDGKVGINQSTDFLSNYWQVLSNIREEKQPEDRKGKSPMLEMKEIHEEPKKNEMKSRWKPPDTGWQCLSVDASFIKESNFASWGALARNHLGQIKWSAWGILSDCDNAETAEALACLEGIKQAVKLVDSSLIIESDCDALIKKANSDGRDRSHTSSVLADIHRLVTLLPNFTFRKVAREDNRPAHELARFSRVSCTGGVLQGSAPPCVLELTLVECNQNSTTD